MIFPLRRLKPMLVGTYHKAGTVWMGDVFDRIGRKAEIPFTRLERHEHGAPAPRYGIYFQTHSQFPDHFWDHDIRGFRIIRDPRDVIVSGAHYHARSQEPWLHEPNRAGGKSYADVINGFHRDSDRYIFEMDNTGQYTILSMWTSNGDARAHGVIEKSFLTLRYEDLIIDPDGAAFLPVVRHFRLPRKIALKAYRFCHMANKEGEDHAGHIRSGKVAQWQQKFDRTTAEAFAKRFQGALEALGYESNTEWVRQF